MQDEIEKKLGIHLYIQCKDSWGNIGDFYRDSQGNQCSPTFSELSQAFAWKNTQFTGE